jgi:tetratricopeptide (TPR) repeat protein
MKRDERAQGTRSDGTSPNGSGDLSDGTPEMAPRWRLRLFGPMVLLAPDGRPMTLPGMRARALLALLAVPPRRAWSRAQLSQMLWPDSAGTDSLRQQLSRLGRTFRDTGHASPLLIDAATVALAPHRIDVDLDPHHGAFLEALDVAGAEPFEAWLRGLRLPADVPEGDLPGLATVLVLLPAGGDTSAASLTLPAHDLLRAGLARNASIALSTAPRPAGPGLWLELKGWPGGALSLHLMAGSRQLWAEREVVATEPHALAATVERWLVAIDAGIEEHEQATARRQPAGRAMDDRTLFWRADALFRDWGEAPIAEAIGLLELLVARRPDLARGWALLGFCHASAHASGWQQTGRLASARLYADEAMRRGQNDPYVLGYVAGTELLGFRRPELAARLAARALDLQPHTTAALVWSGWAAVAQSRFEAAEAHFGVALSLNPRSRARGFTLAALGICRLACGAPDEARMLLAESAALVPDYTIGLAGLAATAHMTGEPETARAALLKLQSMGALGHVRSLFVHPAHGALLDAAAAAAGIMPHPSPAATGD